MERRGFSIRLLRWLGLLALCGGVCACGGSPEPTAAAATATPVVLVRLGGGGAATATSASLERGVSETTLRLRAGEEVPLGAGGASVRFEGVVEDSRCPADARCIWQGRVVVELRVLDGGQPASLALGSLAGFDDAPDAIIVAGRTLSIADVEPYPEGSGHIPEERYVLTLAVR